MQDGYASLVKISCNHDIRDKPVRNQRLRPNLTLPEASHAVRPHHCNPFFARLELMHHHDPETILRETLDHLANADGTTLIETNIPNEGGKCMLPVRENLLSS